jgi:diguanylate cyclase (GGDEF)-like protein
MKQYFRKIIGNLFGFQTEIDDLRSRINELSWDSVFGMWTRTAFLQFCRVMPRGQRTIVFIDLDRIHSLNNRHGYTEVDRMVREAFSIPLRQSDIVARWYSGDEIVILFDNDRDSAVRKIQELERSAARQGLSFSHEMGVWDVGSTDIIEVVNGLSTRNKRKLDCREVECESRL